MNTKPSVEPLDDILDKKNPLDLGQHIDYAMEMCNLDFVNRFLPRLKAVPGIKVIPDDKRYLVVAFERPWGKYTFRAELVKPTLCTRHYAGLHVYVANADGLRISVYDCYEHYTGPLIRALYHIASAPIEEILASPRVLRGLAEKAKRKTEAIEEHRTRTIEEEERELALVQDVLDALPTKFYPPAEED